MAISKQRKEEVQALYADWVKRSEAVILVEYSGAKMKSIDAIRAKIRETGGEFHIVKNTLARRALRSTWHEHPCGLSREVHSDLVCIQRPRFHRESID